MANKIYPLNPPPNKPPRLLKCQSIGHISGLTLLTLALCITFIVSLALGSVAIPPSEVLNVLFGGTATKPAWQEIILNFRLPRSLTAMAAGSALAMSGLQLQALFRNALAGPSVLGINAGASLGAAMVVLTGGGMGWLGQLSVVGAASLGAAISMVLVLVMARQVRSSLGLLIFGLMLGYITTALVTILLHFSRQEQTLAYLNWTYGSFSGVTWQQMPWLLSIVVVGLVISQLSCNPLNLLLLGEEQAMSLGLSIVLVRCYLIFSASLLAGGITAFCGPIAFLGVAVPHLGRSLFRTQDHRLLVPVVTLLGALLALVANTIAQMPGSQTVLPLNAVMALLGAPVLIWLMLTQGKQP
ncbi:MAG: iron ABC transporter permease [Cyanobacteria bacterium P01_D01_bin.156]